MAKRKPRIRSRLRIDGVWDLETADWTKFVLGGLRLADGSRLVCGPSPKDERRFVDALLSVEGEVWAHNGGRFDDGWLLDWAVKLGLEAEVFAAGSRVVALKIGQTTFCDSQALVPMSLAKWTGAKSDTGLRCRCGTKCGGYCSIRADLPARLMNRLLEYLCNDLEILWDALAGLQAFADEHDLDLAHTLGAASFRCARRRLDLPAAARDAGAYNRLRWAYYGGRVQSFRPVAPRVYGYDFNSLYPAALANEPLPYGASTLRYRAEAQAAYGRGEDGAYRAIVDVPESFIPPLPVRADFGDGERIGYPFGRLKGVWTGRELRAAEAYGVRIQEVQWSQTYAKSRVIFREWVEGLYALRMRFGKDTWQGVWLKLYMNSFTGKCAQQPGRATYAVNLAPEDFKACKCRRKATDCFCGAHRSISEHVAISKTWRISPCAHIEWTSHLVSAGRVGYLLPAMLEGGGDDVCYCDTDGILSTRQRTFRVGTGLGELLYEGEWKSSSAGPALDVFAPKSYRLGKKKFRFKGFPIRDRTAWERVSAGETIPTHRMRGFKTGAREGVFFARDLVEKKAERGYGDRVLRGEKTYPREMSM